MARNISEELSEKAARDPEFRRRLKTDPRGVLQEELRSANSDAQLPQSVDVQVIEQSANTVYIFVPDEESASAPSGDRASAESVSDSWVSVSFMTRPCKCV